MAKIESFTIGGDPAKPKPPPDPSALWDWLGIIGGFLLVLAGWMVLPAAGVAILGVELLAVGILASRPVSSAAVDGEKDGKKDGKKADSEGAKS